jgi:hypothetical protein
VYEQLPLFIYCKEYLEVITEIILDKASEILLLENFISQLSLKHHTMEPRISKKEHMMIFNCSKGSEDIELELSLSDAVSFGKQDILSPTYAYTKETIGDKTLPKRPSQGGDYFSYNIKKYSLYEINLAYKVFCGLKKRVKKSKNKAKLTN